MRVYGDRPQRERSTELLAQLHDGLQRAAAMPAGLARHSLLVALLIDAGMLAQGVADARCQAIGQDEETPDAHLAMTLVTGFARCCARSWSTGFDTTGRLPFDALAQCTRRLPEQTLALKRPEGYAFYALYPETFFEAAVRCRAAAMQWRVIGLRSIGTSLSAMVAVGLGAPVPRTLRPVGHPFRREIHAPPPADWDADTAFALVDEGPGLSGSSLAAAANWLLQAGVMRRQLHFFPSHEGLPGPQADAAVHALWHGVTRHHVGFDEAMRHAPLPAQRLATWVAPLIGPLTAPLQDIGGGAWRTGQAAGRDAALTPPAHPWQERRKYLAPTPRGPWLLKFVGLGRAGDQAFARARALAAAGFVPEVAGLCHGFIVERWRDDLRPLDRAGVPVDRARLIARVADYLAFRARRFPAVPDSGASTTELCEMLLDNTRGALGDAAAAVLSDATGEALTRACAHAAPRIRRVATDNRLHRWEWLAGPGAILKTDAIDHAAAHDLVGCQDITWDVAGAEIELGLSLQEAAALTRAVESRGVPVDPTVLALMRPCYLAFQWGHFAMAVEAAFALNERAALAAERDRYAAGLPTALAALARCTR